MTILPSANFPSAMIWSVVAGDQFIEAFDDFLRNIRRRLPRPARPAGIFAKSHPFIVLFRHEDEFVVLSSGDRDGRFSRGVGHRGYPAGKFRGAEMAHRIILFIGQDRNQFGVFQVALPGQDGVGSGRLLRPAPAVTMRGIQFEAGRGTWRVRSLEQ